MKRLFSLAILLLVTLVSCDGRKSTNEALHESIEEFKNNTTIEVVTYEPEAYAETITDSLLSNGFNVKIEAYTDLNNNVNFVSTKDTISYQTYYRNYKFRIVVAKENKIIYDEYFDKEKVNMLLGFNKESPVNSPLSNFHNRSVLKALAVNEDPTHQNGVAIDIVYAIPESDRRVVHTLTIDENGQSKITFTEES